MNAVLKLATVNGQAITEQPRKRMQDGFVAIPNDIFDALLCAKIPGNHYKLAMAILRKTVGFGKAEDDCTVQQLADAAGMERQNASPVFHALVDANIVNAKVGRHGYIVSVNPPETWDLTPYQNKTVSKTNVLKSDGRTSEIQTHNRQSQKTTTKEPNGSSSSAKPKTAKLIRVACPHQQLIELYHEKLPACPEVREWTKTREGLMRARWNEKLAAGKYHDLQTGLTYWGRFFEYVGKSDFLTGKSTPTNGKPPFIANLEWIIRPSNFAKIVEGNYDNKGSQ